MKDYIQQAARTKTGLKVPINASNEDLLHATLGLAGESGEIVDQVKAHLFYGRPLDKINLKEELGDKLWYIAMLAGWLGTTIEELMELNIAKLRARFPDKFTEELANYRNLANERKVLEGGDK